MKGAVKFRSRYDVGNNRVKVEFEKESRTKQSFKNECDINHILKMYKKNGIVTHIQARAPMFEDVADALSYQDSLNLVIRAQEQFAALPSKVRARFGNDPAQFLEFCGNSANAKEMVDLGLATARPEAPAVKEPEAPISPPKGGKKGPESAKGSSQAPSAGGGPEA